MAKRFSSTSFQRFLGGLALSTVLAVGLAAASAPEPPLVSGSATAASDATPARRDGASRGIKLAWRPVPRVFGRITSQSLGVVINSSDPLSVALGEYYIAQRRIAPEHVLRVELPQRARLTKAEFEAFKLRVDEFFGPEVQGLALVWRTPYAVECQSINAALALGFAPDLCSRSCDKGQLSPYFNSPSSQPFKQHGMRPSMLLAARTLEQGRQLIDRGVASDHTLGLRGALPVEAHYVWTSDQARSVRGPLFPPPGPIAVKSVQVMIDQVDQLRDRSNLLLVQTGQPRLLHLDTLRWVPGALADHLTSYGGVLDGDGGQTSALAWLESGATASYGTVSEPCNHPQKFPHPQLLLLHYLQGSTALEAYWKSVAWPQQGVFIGEPLAAPFAPAPASAQ